MNIIFFRYYWGGKPSLLKVFSDWLKKRGKVACINLDPGVEELPYNASFDIRNFFTIESIMKEEKLDSNGALLRSIEKMIEMKEEIRKEIEKIKDCYRLIDLPGQVEPFIFNGGEKIIKIFNLKGV